MASTITSILHPNFSLKSSSSPSSRPVSVFPNLHCPFLGSAATARTRIGVRRLGPSCGSRATCWFRFGTNGVDAEGAGIYGSQSKNDFNRDDVEQYFNYMGMLAVEGSYDKMEHLLNQNIHPVDVLLLMAASEGDQPKIEELMRAGANYTIKDADGRTALDRAANDEIKEFILGFSFQQS